MSVVERAQLLRPIIENAVQKLDDAVSLEAIELFPKWTAGILYTVDEKVVYDGILYKCLQSHTSQTDWTPDIAVSLFARVLNPDPEVIPVWEQPDSTNPYMKGDKVHFPGESDPIYESLIDNNVWSPAAYPAGWNVVE